MSVIGKDGQVINYIIQLLNGQFVATGTFQGESEIQLTRGRCYNYIWSAAASSNDYSITLGHTVLGDKITADNKTWTIQAGETDGTFQFCIKYQLEYEGNDNLFFLTRSKKSFKFHILSRHNFY